MVLAKADVEVGKWTDGCAGGGENCFEKGPAVGTSCVNYAFPSGTGNCNAVRVTTRRSATNNNALQLVFAPLIGISSFETAAQAIAVYGLGNINVAQPTWNVIVVQDITGSL